MLGTLIAGAAIGGALNFTSSLLSRKSQKDALRRQKNQIKELRDTYLQNLDTQFNIEKAEAQKTAESQNMATDIQEGVISDSFNNEITSLNQQQQAETLAWNIEAQKAGQATGNALSQQAVSGTRNSSVNDAIDQEAALNASQLQMQQDQQRTQDNYALRSAAASLAQANIGVQQARTQADNLVNGYEAGGNQYAVYKGSRDYNEKQYNQKIDEINREMKNLSWGWNTFLNVSASTISGAASGAQTGYALGNFANYVSNPNVKAQNNNSIWGSIGSYFKNKWGTVE